MFPCRLSTRLIHARVGQRRAQSYYWGGVHCGEAPVNLSCAAAPGSEGDPHPEQPDQRDHDPAGCPDPEVNEGGPREVDGECDAWPTSLSEGRRSASRERRCVLPGSSGSEADLSWKAPPRGRRGGL